MSNTSTPVVTATNPTPAPPVSVATIPTTPPISCIDLSASNAIKVVTSTLDRGSNNWSEWSVNFKDYLLSKHAWAYIPSAVTRPVEADDPVGVALWDANNEAIVAIMRGRCSLEEKLFLEGQTNAFRAWKILHKRQIGPIAQINHIQKLLQLRYRKSERFAKTSLEVSETVRHIYAMGMPTSETFSLIMMMNAMGNELPHVRDQIADAIVHSTPSNPYMPTMVHVRLEMEQQLVNSKSLSSNHLALAASAKSAPSRRSSKVCTNPKCPPEQ